MVIQTMVDQCKPKDSIHSVFPCEIKNVCKVCKECVSNASKQ